MIVIVMGAAGSGKTTVARELAAELGWRFIEGDDLHSPENVAKMRAGIGLTDADRQPWLRAVRAQIEAAHRDGESATVACSALTNEYREFLGADLPVRFVYLRVTRDVLEQRLRERKGHFAGPSLLKTQLATLEEPNDSALTIDATLPLAVNIKTIRTAFDI
jgi:gluconokinase